MPLPEPHPYFTVTAKHPEEKVINAFVEERMKAATDRLHDVLGIPRKGREPDYLYGRWCVQCHNSLPQEWREPCDVCGAATVMDANLFDGLLNEIHGGIPRAEKEDKENGRTHA